MDACRELQKKLETLQEEKQHPAPPTVSLQPENTAGALQQSFDEENRRRILSSRTPETAMRLGGAVLLGAVSVLLALELFGNRELLIDSASIAALGETGSSGKMMLLVAHILVSLAVLCGVGRRRADRQQQLAETRRRQEEMEYLARDSARSRAQMVDQLNSIGNILYYDLHF